LGAAVGRPTAPSPSFDALGAPTVEDIYRKPPRCQGFQAVSGA
jgi:hypothetical protein